MPSTYTQSGRLTKQGVGENNNTWGAIANTQYDLIDDMVNGVLEINVTTGTDITLTISNGSSDESRHKTLKLTGTPTANIDIIVPAVPKEYLIDAAFSGSFTVSITPTGGGDNINFTAGQKGVVYCDGVDIKEIFKSLTLGSLATKDTVATADIDNAAITTGKLADNVVTFAKMVQLNAMKLIGNLTGSPANATEVAVSTDITMADNSDSIIPTQKAVKSFAQNNPAVPKAYAYFNNSGTLLGGYGVSSITKFGVGLFGVNLSTPFVDKNKMCVQCNNSNGTGDSYNRYVRWDISNTTTSIVRIRSMYQEDNGYGIANRLEDDNYYTVVVYGDNT